ncbi:MAG: hypothetical protein IPI39_06450 [Candidatus Obscuribacter sp.]|nr:hypothetical protein [Candidatus Obscuribacter sp.]
MGVLLVGKTMHNVRKFIVVTALVFLAVTALYPPWQHKDSAGVAVPMGYSFAWQPPVYQKRASADIFGLTINLNMQPVRANSIDLNTLFKNWLLVLCVGAGAYGATLLTAFLSSQGRRGTHGTAN